MKLTSILLLLLVGFVTSCVDSKPTKESKESLNEIGKITDTMSDKGVGPIKEIVLEPIDFVMVKLGGEIFKTKCRACHRVGTRFIGPNVVGLLDRRSPEWIMNMILNPEQMIKENEQARKLLKEYSAPMANQNLTENEARLVLEYFRSIN